MSEDYEFKLLEQRLNKQKENQMNNLPWSKQPYNPQEHIEALEERRLWDEHQVKVANARLSANAKQVAGDHYTKMDIEPWDVIDTWPLEQRIGFYRGNALKYIMRCGTKDERLQEVKKAAHYVEKLIEILK